MSAYISAAFTKSYMTDSASVSVSLRVLTGSYFTVVGSSLDGVTLTVEGDEARLGGRVGEVLIGGAQVRA